MDLRWEILAGYGLSLGMKGKMDVMVVLLTLTALGQTDFANGSVVNRGGSLSTGLLILFP